MKYLKKSLKGRTPYYSKMIEDGIILNANESAFDAPKEIIEEFKKEIDGLNLKRYPDTDNTIVRKAIAKSYNIDIKNVTCGVGSDQLLDCIFKSIIDKDDYILACNPTFSMYQEYAYYVNYDNSKFKNVDFIVNDEEGFVFDVKKIIKKINYYNPKVVIICSPNNPTGSIIKRDDLEEIIKLTNGVVLLDEAYSDFYTESNYDLALKYNNVIVLKTFSKAYALAGIRLGYAISCPDLIDTINVVKPPYNLSTISQKIAAIAINNKDLYKKQIDETVKLKDELYDSLKELGLKPIKSYSNFIFVKFDPEINEILTNNKIYIRKLKYKNKIYYRINTGTKDQNDTLIKKIEEVLPSIKAKESNVNDLKVNFNIANINFYFYNNYVYFDDDSNENNIINEKFASEIDKFSLRTSKSKYDFRFNIYDYTNNEHLKKIVKEMIEYYKDKNKIKVHS